MIYLPENIKVGYVKRAGTFTGQLAYVVYQDAGGVWRKETSFDRWRDHDIPVTILENEPVSGFVLNKKAGGYSTGWNTRSTYCRVYDPRGWEFEIDIENLLYILENANSIRGKGLEGEFVYGWSSGDIVLMPTSSPDYQQLSMLSNKAQNWKRLTKKDMVKGHTYLSHTGDRLVYLDHATRYMRYHYGENPTVPYKSKYYFFANEETGTIECFGSLTRKILECVDDQPHPRMAHFMEQLLKDIEYVGVDIQKDIYVPITADELEATQRSAFYVRLGRELDNPRYIRKNKDVSPARYMLYGEKAKTAEEFVALFKPHRRIRYLTNGKIYSQESII